MLFLNIANPPAIPVYRTATHRTCGDLRALFAAEVLQVTIGTVWKLARDGRLQGAKIGRHWRSSERDIERFMEEAKPKKTSTQ